jgi:hypothetical protein
LRAAPQHDPAHANAVLQLLFPSVCAGMRIDHAELRKREVSMGRRSFGVGSMHAAAPSLSKGG